MESYIDSVSCSTLYFVPAAAAISRIKIWITSAHFPQNGTVSATNSDL